MSISKKKNQKNRVSEKTGLLHFNVWLNALSLFLTFKATAPRVNFTAIRHFSSDTWLSNSQWRLVSYALPLIVVTFLGNVLHELLGWNVRPMIYGLPAQRGYATMHVFRCIIRVSWDLIKITASKIPFKWNCSQMTMADTSSCRLFLFFAQQRRKANPCFNDSRQEGHKLCSFVTL